MRTPYCPKCGAKGCECDCDRQKLYTVEGSVEDSGYYVYGIFESRETAQKFIDDNWIWHREWNRIVQPSGYVKLEGFMTTEIPSWDKGRGPDGYCDKEEVVIGEYELGVPIKLYPLGDDAEPPAWR